MALKTKSIFAPKEEDDGLRISIMSRHTQNDGKTPDLRIEEGKSHDLWWKQLAPPPKLVGWWYRSGKNSFDMRNLWDEVFVPAFQDHLKNEESRRKLVALNELAMNGNVTIMCAEDTPEFCHRKLVAEQLRSENRKIELILR